MDDTPSRAPRRRRHAWDDGTVLSVQPATVLGARDAWLAIMFDGRPMIRAGIPSTIAELQRQGAVAPLTTVYVESIEGATTRGPTRVASLTDPAVLARFVERLEHQLAYDLVPQGRVRRLALGHSLGGNAALHIACRWPERFGAVATGSAALWWPGDDVQLPGSQVSDEVLTSAGLRLWMQAGTEEGDLLESNRRLWARADAARIDLAHYEHPGGHELAAWRDGLTQALPHLLPPAPPA